MKTFTFGVIILCILAAFGISNVGTTSQPITKVVDESISSHNIASDGEIDYEYESVPVTTIELSVDGNIKEIQPRQTFNISYTLNPWYTTTKQVYVDIFPQSAGIVTSLDCDNKMATIEVASDAEVGSVIAVTVSADNVVSNAVEVSVIKIPVDNIAIAVDNDAVLHMGRSNSFTTTIVPSYATNTKVVYELSGNGLQYIESFDKQTGEIKAKDRFDEFTVGSTVTVTAIAVDNEHITSSVTLTLVIPTVSVDLSATTPLNVVTLDNKPLAVAASGYADTVALHTLVNGVDSFGLNYVIVSGQDYIKNGAIKPDGSFELKKTAEWTTQMKVPHAEVRVKVAYSDGFDEIIVSIYVPIESYAFDNSVPNVIENNRQYDFKATGYPNFATYLADNQHNPLVYSLNGVDSDKATIDSNGLVSLPKSLTSKNTNIKLSTHADGWSGVDAAPLEHNMTIVPVYAEAFDRVTLLKNGVAIDPEHNRVFCDDIIGIEIVFDKDNVTELSYGLSENSNMISVNNNKFVIVDLAQITSNNPILDVAISYSQGGNNFSTSKVIAVYVESKFANIDDAVFERGIGLDLNELITINNHNFATNKNITWGDPRIIAINGQTGIEAILQNGILKISSRAHAGTTVCVPYMTADGDWQEKRFTVGELDSRLFRVSYGADKSNNHSYEIMLDAPQLEEGRSIDMYLKYAGFDINGLSASKVYGVSYNIKYLTNNATLSFSSNNPNEAYDLFKLGAKVGEDGNSNIIKYSITISDGNHTYTVSTDGKYANPIAIFNRISGNVGVLNNKIMAGEAYTISGWDSFATCNPDDITWKIADSTLSDAKMISKTKAFVLNLSAVQKYNGQDIVWETNIGFSVLSYKDGDTVMLYVYKKNNATITIEDSTHIAKDNFVLKGWDTSSRGDKDDNYAFGKSFSGNADFSLWACWTTTRKENNVGSMIYQGRENYCQYNVLVCSSSVDNNNYHTSGFSVRILGDSCVRTITTSFGYKITFRIMKNGKEIKSNYIKFTIWDKDNVPGNSRAVFDGAQLDSPGDYRLEWDGVIDSNENVNISGAYDFRINCN